MGTGGSAEQHTKARFLTALVATAPQTAHSGEALNPDERRTARDW
jgi:hypothetical protein